MMGPVETRDTLCIRCGNACNRGCSWSDKLEPVRGWVAEENGQGFRVVICPEFVRDTRPDPQDFDNSAVISLLQAALRLARKDYISGHGYYDASANRKGMGRMDWAKIHKANRDLIEKWIFGFNRQISILPLSDPEAVVEYLRREAAKHDARIAKMEKEGRDPDEDPDEEDEADEGSD